MKLSGATSVPENAGLLQMGFHSPKEEENSGLVVIAMSSEAASDTKEATQARNEEEYSTINTLNDKLLIQHISAHAPAGDTSHDAHSDAELQKILRESGISHENVDTRSLLSPREIAVLELLSEGQSNKYIARELDIAEPTVKCHVKSILRKLNVRNRFEAAMWVLRARGQLLI
ncbi:DNA-binding NarL/FixJ family response regulator [Pseudochelatococcus lubricantis]|uniref:DNA-binding NarL/FixJ family response regulator n=1 Tax=Pseudochelatococcus lubricantis TaxID=1538102 RepID=A0ABX0UYP6_9HYPH|nr:DNA-binding NarL/FixJ family response regulator [Pseudochelatococcus lubricantis]